MPRDFDINRGGGLDGVPGADEAAHQDGGAPGQPARIRLRRPADDALGTPEGAARADRPGVGAPAGTAERRAARKEARRKAVDGGAGIDRGEGSILSRQAAPDAGPDYTYRKLRLHKSEELDPYAAGRDAQTALDPRVKRCIALGVAALVVLVAALVLPSGWFSVNMRSMTLAQWMVELQHRVAGLVSFVTFQGASYSMDFITYRYLIVALAGAALGISGAVYQGSLKNALASPTTLGVMSGCNLGRIVYVMFFMNTGIQVSGVTVSTVSSVLGDMGGLQYLWTVYGMALSALVGGIAVVTLVILVATLAGKGRMSGVVMVIAGQVVTSVISAGVSLAQYYYTETGDARAEILRNLQVQSFTNTFRALDVALVGIPVVICVALVLAQRSKLNLLAFKDEEARSMGLSTARARWVTVIACTALTGVIVAFCGQIGMVGFMVPHLVRRIVGPDFKYLVPASAFAGAAFLVLAYFATSLFEADTSVFGVYTSIIGGLVFLIIAVKQRGRGRGDWM